MSNKPLAKPITLFLLSSLFVWHLFLLSVTAKGVEFFVSPTGSDNWSGSPAYANTAKTDGPKATLTAALEAARKVGAEKQRRIVLQAGALFDAQQPSGGRLRCQKLRHLQCARRYDKAGKVVSGPKGG